MNTRRGLVAILALTVLATGCSLVRKPAPPREPAEVVDAVLCRIPRGGESSGVLAPGELMREVRAGAIPTDFEPVSASSVAGRAI
ncbi:hypothetical protein ACFRFQ_17980 [Rhodococcus sp. NPDC056743]|uniref:hypothetical protein n=1 Tax=Rhodococcus sp. NPDC056743 TaxID=3345934 RepID=UPI00366DC480